MPQRIQQRRIKGWRKPAGAISVARPSRWGNPFPVQQGDHTTAVRRFEAYLQEHPELIAAARVALRGHDLMCFCPLTEPCHADVWLRVVNVPRGTEPSRTPREAAPPCETAKPEAAP